MNNQGLGRYLRSRDEFIDLVEQNRVELLEYLRKEVCEEGVNHHYRWDYFLLKVEYAYNVDEIVLY